MKRYLSIILLVVLFSVECIASPTTIRILHINDFHGFANPIAQVTPKPEVGGAARLAKKIRELRIDNSTLLLVAGDAIQGDTWANLSQGSSSVELMNLIGVDAMVTGNHEFDFGQEVLNKRVSEAKFPILAANVNGLPSVLNKAYFTRQGVRIAVIGLVTDDTPQTSHPRNTKGLTFASPLDTARKQISETGQGVNLIVLLTHLGFEKDRAMAKELCERENPATTIPILIVGGHSHTRVEQPVRIGNCTVVQAWEQGKTLGMVDLTIDNGNMQKVNGRLIDITPTLDGGDQQVAALVDKYNHSTTELLGKTVATAAVNLIQTGARQQETNLGNLVADIVRQTSGAQVALINGGSLRTSILKGDITVRMIHNALPFNNYLVAVKMSGAQLLQTLEHGVSGIETGEGRFPQVSGISFSFNAAKPVGKRIIYASVNNIQIDPEQEYTVATLDFIAAGGDGYCAFGEAIRSSGDFLEVAGAMKSSRLVYNDPGRFLRDIVLESLASSKTIAPIVEGRIIQIH